MRFYHIALGIWMLMAIIAMINSLGLFQTQIPNSNFDTTTGDAQISQLYNTVNKSTDSNWFTQTVAGVGLIGQSLGFIATVFWHSINLVSFGDAYTVDRRISIPIQGFYSFILVFGIYQFLTGRATKIMD